MKQMLTHTILKLSCVGFFLSGCATYQGKVGVARSHLESGNPDAAIALLKPLAETPSDDQLIYLLDYATALQVKGDYKASSQILLQADRLAENMDYTSVSRVAGSLLFSEELVQYRGEDFEKLLIHVMAALNYTLMGNLESARVETRRLTDKLNYFRSEKKLKYAENPFMYYLNGHIWEANKDWDSAYIDFKKAYDLGMDNSWIRQDLIRLADRSRRPDALRKWRKQFGNEDAAWKNKRKGELLLIYQQGWGPRKAPHPNAPRFPTLRPTGSSITQAALVVDGKEVAKTEEAYNIEAAAMTALETQYAALVAKRIAGMVAKDVAAKQVAKKDEMAGAALWVLMHATDRADLRQWSTLPRTIQVARVYLPEGKHKIKVQGLRSLTGGGPSSEEIELNVKAGRKHFVGWRSF